MAQQGSCSIKLLRPEDLTRLGYTLQTWSSADQKTTVTLLETSGRPALDISYGSSKHYVRLTYSSWETLLFSLCGEDPVSLNIEESASQALGIESWTAWILWLRSILHTVFETQDKPPSSLKTLRDFGV